MGDGLRGAVPGHLERTRPGVRPAGAEGRRLTLGYIHSIPGQARAETWLQLRREGNFEQPGHF